MMPQVLFTIKSVHPSEMLLELQSEAKCEIPFSAARWQLMPWKAVGGKPLKN